MVPDCTRLAPPRPQGCHVAVLLRGSRRWLQHNVVGGDLIVARPPQRSARSVDRWQGVDAAADPDRRLMRLLGLCVALAAVLGGLTGAAGWVIERVNPRSAPIDRYLVDPDGRAPGTSAATSMLGINHGMTVEQVDRLMPDDAVETTEAPDLEGSLASRSWSWDGLSETVEFEPRLFTVSGPIVSREDAAAASHVLLPRGLILGRSTLRDFVAVLGVPTAADQSAKTGRPELDLGWEVMNESVPDQTDFIEVALLIPTDEVVGDPLGNAICSVVPWVYAEPTVSSVPPLTDVTDEQPIASNLCTSD